MGLYRFTKKCYDFQKKLIFNCDKNPNPNKVDNVSKNLPSNKGTWDYGTEDNKKSVWDQLYDKTKPLRNFRNRVILSKKIMSPNELYISNRDEPNSSILAAFIMVKPSFESINNSKNKTYHLKHDFKPLKTINNKHPCEIFKVEQISYTIRTYTSKKSNTEYEFLKENNLINFFGNDRFGYLYNTMENDHKAINKWLVECWKCMFPKLHKIKNTLRNDFIEVEIPQVKKSLVKYPWILEQKK